MTDSLEIVTHLMESNLHTTQELAKTSSFDSMSIFIVVSQVCLIFIFIFLFYVFIMKVVKSHAKSIEVIEATRKENMMTLEERIKLSEKSLTETLSAYHETCKERSLNTKSTMDKSISLINTSIENLYNAIVEETGEGGKVSVRTALYFFTVVMDLHCLRKANIIYTRSKYSNGTATSILPLISHEFKQMTEGEKTFLDTITYTNNHKLGEELEFILRKENWNNFIDTNVGFLLTKFLGKNPSWTDVMEESNAMFMSIISPMKENIKKKGGLT